MGNLFIMLYTKTIKLLANPMIHLRCTLVVLAMLSCIGNRVYGSVGANTPFTSYEAEAGTLAGGAAVVSLTAAPTTQYSSPQLEASGHAYVQDRKSTRLNSSHLGI